jgi:hypothetical protein
LDKRFDLKLTFETTSGKNDAWTLKGVREDIAGVYRPLAEAIIASGVYNSRGKGDITSVLSALLTESTSMQIFYS